MSRGDNLLSVPEGDSLTIAEGDKFSAGAVIVGGSIAGDGLLGLDWSIPTSAESLENISAQIEEQNIPTLAINEEVMTRSVVVSAVDVGAESYTITFDDGEPETLSPPDFEIRYTGLEPSSEHTVQLTATNSRGDTLTAEWDITLGAFISVYEVEQALYAQPNQTHGANSVFMARIKDKETGVPLKEEDVASITLNAWKYRRDTNGDSRDEVPGFIGVPVPVDSVLPSVSPSDFWDLDNIGINFLHVPDQRENLLFPTPGAYLVEYVLALKAGNPINLHYEFHVY